MSEQLSFDKSRSQVVAIFGLWAQARIDHHPVKTYCLFSGGDDSLVLLNLFGRHVDGVVYVNTGTGIPETTEFVRATVEAAGLPLHELHPPLSYEQVFLEDPIIDGLPGPGMHRIAYSRLKERALRTFRRDHHLKGRQRIMFLTGIRHDESVKRMGYTNSVVDREGRVVWVNPIYWLTRAERNAFLAAKSITRNPVSEHLHISGECLCGCFAKPGELDEIAFVMFSSGAGSAAAAKRVADACGTDDLILLFADVNGEHGDNYRFLREAAQWIGGELVVINNGGKTIWQVFSEGKFLGNTRVDLCSRVLKREPMRKWLDDNCHPQTTRVYLGFDWTEEHRHERAAKHWSPWMMESPLLWEPVIDKSQALQWLADAGIAPPLLTARGFPHANCGGGCVKAGIGQFKKLYFADPAEFAKWEWNEERLRQQLGNVSILRDRKGGTTKPFPLSRLREQLEQDNTLFADEDYGGCNCFTPLDEDDQ